MSGSAMESRAGDVCFDRASLGRLWAVNVGIEVRRLFARRQTRGFLGLVLLSLVPFGMVLVDRGPDTTVEASAYNEAYAFIFHGLILRFLCFFGCAMVFSHAIREEQGARTLHYSLLIPQPRWLVISGRYAASVLVVGGVLSGALLASQGALWFTVSGTWADLLIKEKALFFLLAYVVIVWLGVSAYGALFTSMELLFSRPAIPIALFFGWEWLTFILPPALKRVGIGYYLHQLAPLSIAEGPWALLGDPLPIWESLLSLFLITGGWLFVSFRLFGRIELHYD